jgi:YD repeat-containing protein
VSRNRGPLLSIGVTYESLGNTENYSLDGSDPPAYVHPRRQGYVVTTQSHDDGIGGTREFTHYYDTAYQDIAGRGWSAFDYHRVNDVAQGTHTQRYFDRTFPYAGMLVKEELRRTSDNQLIREVTHALDKMTWTQTTPDRLQRIVYPVSPDYPAGFRVRYDYNARGYLSEVHNDDASNALIWRLNDDTLDLTDITLGNGIHATRSYRRETGEVSRIRAASPTSPSGTFDVEDLYYEFDTLGNLTLRQDVNRNVEERSGSYVENGVTKDSYDELNRLTRVERVLGAVSQQVKTYTYDPLGNLTSKSDLGALTYDYTTNPTSCAAVPGAVPSGPHAVKQIGPGQFCYDANGNQLTGFTANGARTLTWTS